MPANDALIEIGKMPEIPVFSTIKEIHVWAEKVCRVCTLNDWKILPVDFDNDNLGACNIRGKIIELSSNWLEHFIKNKQYEDIKRLVLHEIAHALAGTQNIYLGRNHGRLWQNYCKLLGIKGEKAKYYYE